MANASFFLRKLAHIIICTALITLGWFFIGFIGKERTLLLAGLVLLIEALAEFARVEYGWFSFSSVLTKCKENNHFSALTLGLASGIIVLAVFEPSLAFAAIAAAVFGDAAAAIAGTYFGRHKPVFNPKKSWEGFAANLIVGFAASQLFVTPFPCAIMAFVSALFELATYHTEDNFLIPLLTAFVGYAVVYI